MKIKQILLVATILLFSTFANAALESRLGGLAVYDTDLDITWLADANLAASNTFGVSGVGLGTWIVVDDVEMTWINAGSMSFTTANNWIYAMNTNNYLGYHDWRLPDTLLPDPSCGYYEGSQPTGNNCLGSEMGHLFYNELRGVAGGSVMNASLFQNIQTNPYWSEAYLCTAGRPCLTDGVWIFDFGSGSQNLSLWSGVAISDPRSVWVVRDGDVATVPVPTAAWLLGSGLLGLIGVARRKAA